jgi:hypothetical protein
VPVPRWNLCPSDSCNFNPGIIFFSIVLIPSLVMRDFCLCNADETMALKMVSDLNLPAFRQ